MLTNVMKEMTGSINNGTYALGGVLICTAILVLSLPAATFRRPRPGDQTLTDGLTASDALSQGRSA